jgi:transglutaminase-like putative cysteine protease
LRANHENQHPREALAEQSEAGNERACERITKISIRAKRWPSEARPAMNPDTYRKPRMAGRHQLGLVAAAATLLASAPLMSLYENWTWLVRSAFAVAMIAGAAAAARALRAPVWVQLVVMPAALLLSLTWQFGGGERMSLVPTPGTFQHFGELLGEVPDAVAAEAIPVSDRPGLLLLTTLGVGVVAILVDFAAVGLRRPAVAGLPMLAIYSVPVAVFAGSVPWYTFVIGAFGYLWLVGADNLDRVRRFGRRFTGDGRDVDLWEPSPLAAAGRRLTVVGALIAVLLPVVVPGMTTGLIDRFGPGIAGTGEGEGGSATSINLFAALSGLLNRDVTQDLVQFTTDDPSPYYLRLGIADQVTERGFNHRNPQGAPVTEPLPGESLTEGNGVTLNRHHAQVEILDFGMNRAPVFSEPTAITGLSDDWNYDSDQQVVFRPDAPIAGTYEFDYTRAEFDPEALRNAAPLAEDDPIQQELTEVPEVSEITELVAGLVAGQTTPYDRVLAIRDYFSRANGFTYSLETGPETTGEAIVDFAIVNKAGFCLQYATAMAWLVREAGLPARVAFGFSTGSERSGETYLLTNHNAHAWTEVYFDGFGWVPFDPTPSLSVPGSVNQPWSPDPDRPQTPTTNNPNPGPNEGRPPNSTAPPPGGGDEFIDPGGAPGGGPLGTSESSWPLWVGGAVALVLSLLMLPALRRSQLRRRRIPRGPAEVALATAPGIVSGEPAAAARHRAHAAWEELLDTMLDFQVALDPAETPRLTAARLVRECRFDAISRDAGDGVRLLGQAEERARYAPAPLAPAGLGTALRAVRRGLAGQSSRRTRLRAALLPPSTLLRWQNGLGEAFSRSTTATNRIGEALSRLSPRRILRPSSS